MPDIFTSEEQHTQQKKPHSHRPPTPSISSSRPVIVRPITRTTKKEIPHGNHMNPLAAFAVDPRDVRFATQGENERIHLFLRRHFITNVPWILFSIFLILVPPVILPLFGTAFPFVALPASLAVILTLFYYVAVFGMVILTSFINWYFNVYIATNERIVDVDFINILYKEVSATRLNLIQDVTSKSGGVIRAIFDYGDVFIQTAGTEANFDFHAVPHPQQVAREIEKLMEQARKKEGVSDLEGALEK